MLEMLSNCLADGPPPELIESRDLSFDAILREYLSRNFHDYRDITSSIFAQNIETFVENAGFGFFADISGLHRALPPLSAPRLIFYARYGMFKNKMPENDEIHPVSLDNWPDRIGRDLRSRYINRLLVETSVFH